MHYGKGCSQSWVVADMELVVQISDEGDFDTDDEGSSTEPSEVMIMSPKGGDPDAREHVGIATNRSG